MFFHAKTYPYQVRAYLHWSATISGRLAELKEVMPIEFFWEGARHRVDTCKRKLPLKVKIALKANIAPSYACLARVLTCARVPRAMIAPEEGSTHLYPTNVLKVCPLAPTTIDEMKDKREQCKAEGRFLVGAIDFGTTNSGWAYSLCEDFQTDPTKGFVQHWYAGSGTLTTEKAPTCLLIKPDGKTLEAFGYEAENRYRALADGGEHEGYYYFRRFKMMLNKNLGDKLNRKMTLKDEMGKSLNALDVFGMAIKYLVEDMMKVVNDSIMSPLETKHVYWVLTVPAIWTDASKQFMREAALVAGLSKDNLTIALEPEAASIFCRHLSVDTAVCGGNISIAKMSVGTVYMILDAGGICFAPGGTINITVHEVISAHCVREIQAASGGGWGGTLVDKAFENLLIDLVGKREVYDTFKKSETEDWLDLWRDFEVKKRTITPEKTARVIMKLPLSFIKTFETAEKRKLEDAIAASKYADDIDFGGDKIKCSANVFKGLFENSIQKTVDHIKAILRDENVKNIKASLMVGGYSESPMLQQAVKNEFPGKDVVIPLGASSTILRGALVYGHSPISITERVLKYTYGVRCTEKFKEGIDPEHNKIVTAKGVHCWIFSKHVEKGQMVKCNETQVAKGYITTDKFQRKVTFHVFASAMTNPRYTDECTLIGKIALDLPEPEESPGRCVLVSMTFSGTEIEVKAVDKKSGKEEKACVDFLSHTDNC